MPRNEHPTAGVQVTESADRDVGEARTTSLDVEESDAADDFLNQFETVKQSLNELQERAREPEEFENIGMLT